MQEIAETVNLDPKPLKVTANLNPNPLLDLETSARYIGFKNARSLSVVLCLGRYPLLNQGAIYIGRRPFFRAQTLEAFLESRTGAALAEAG